MRRLPRVMRSCVVLAAIGSSALGVVSPHAAARVGERSSNLRVSFGDSLERGRLVRGSVEIYGLPLRAFRESCMTDSRIGARFSLPGGRYLVRVWGFDGYASKLDSVALVPGRTRMLDVRLRHVLPFPGSLEILVREPDGRPVEGATIHVSGHGARVSDSQGRALFRELPPGVVSIETWEPQHERAQGSIEIRSDAMATSQLVLPPFASRFVICEGPIPTATLTVSLVSPANGSPAAGITVRIEDAERARHARTTDSTGSAVFALRGDDALGWVRVSAGDTLGYGPIELRIRVWAGDEQAIELPLRRMARRSR